MAGVIRSDYPVFAKGESLVRDYQRAKAAAAKAGDSVAEKRLARLWLERFERKFTAMTCDDLIRYLKSKGAWRMAGVRPVYKLGEGPFLAFTATGYIGGDIDLIGLGICSTYPGGTDNDWWTNVIQPRVGTI